MKVYYRASKKDRIVKVTDRTVQGVTRGKHAVEKKHSEMSLRERSYESRPPLSSVPI